MAVPKRYDSSILPEDKVGLVLVALYIGVTFECAACAVQLKVKRLKSPGLLIKTK